jgi:aminoglycoside 6'-N-acetyltransferase I
VKVRRADSDDVGRLAEMRLALWPDDDATAENLHALVADPEYAVFVAEQDGSLVGFAEIGVRPYAEGADGPAAYLEGIWVDESSRRRGVARALADAGASWGKARGLTHFGSDALIDNDVSHAWHRAIGFAEVERLVVFARRID